MESKSKKKTVLNEHLKQEVADAKTHSFSIFNYYSPEGIAQAIKNCVSAKKKPVIVCIGSDLVLGDSLGPLVGTMLLKRSISTYVYGTLSYPITAKEIGVAKTYLSLTHPNSPIIAIDAAVGSQDDVGLIRVKNKGLFPGLGVAKKLGEIGTASIMGVVAEKSIQNYSLFNLTRLGMIYKMAEQITDGIEEYIKTNFIEEPTENSLEAKTKNKTQSIFSDRFTNVFADAN